MFHVDELRPATVSSLSHMSLNPETGSSGDDVAQRLQQTVHGLVEELFQMLGDGEARSTDPKKEDDSLNSQPHRSRCNDCNPC